MCLSSLPGLARVRHCSCPERRLSLSQEELLVPVWAKDGESLPRAPGLTLWEDKVLSLRGSRGNCLMSGARPRRPPWLLLATSCLLLHTTPILAQMDLFDLTGPKEPICADGVFRGNIDINNRDDDSKMSSLARYINCSVVEGSISITSVLYSDKDTNYSIPNLTEVVSHGALLLSLKYSTFLLAPQLFSSINTMP